LLVLSFYYPPDLSAGSFRTGALIQALIENLATGGRVEVMTTLPNRYSTFSSDAPPLETHPGVEIRRIELPGHRSGMLDQSRAFLRYAREVRRHVGSRRYDVVYATSSRLMTAVLGSWIARRQKARLYLDIRDIFVENFTGVLPVWLALPVRPVLALLERWTFRRADRINLVSRGFKPYFDARYPGVPSSFHSNGVDPEFMEAGARVRSGRPARTPLRVLYAGNMGEGQGLHVIIPDLARRLRGRAVFRLIGDGGRKGALQAALRQAGVDNVQMELPMKRDALIRAYQDADILFLHLNDYRAFENVLPSKLFEYAAMGKPIWAGVSGYAAEFIRSEISNAAVFPPCDAVGAERVLATLALADAPRTDFMEKFSRRKLMRAVAEDVLVLEQRDA
jgi:glycosyltransferase involved in cell wall biosynthesis